MSTAAISSLAPLTLGSTTLAVDALSVPPEVAVAAYRHSGNLFGSVVVAPGAAPRATFKTPFYEAYAEIGLTGKRYTTANLYLSKFSNGLKSASTDHLKYSLAASCEAFAYITGFSASQGGIAMADVSVVFLSNNGTTHPLSRGTGSLPTLAAQPALRTLGPATINGTTIGGITSMSVDLAPTITTVTSDGDLYPRVCAYEGGDPVISCEHSDPATLAATLEMIGAAISSNFVAYLRDYSTTTGLTQTTAISLTVASGRVVPEAWTADNLAVAKGGFRVIPTSTDTTHPIVVATGATAPTP